MKKGFCAICGKPRPAKRIMFCSRACAAKGKTVRGVEEQERMDVLTRLHFRTPAECREYWGLDRKDPAPYRARTMADAEALKKEGL